MTTPGDLDEVADELTEMITDLPDCWASGTDELRHIAIEGGHMFIDTEKEILLMQVCLLLHEMAERDNVATPNWGSP